MCVAWLVRAVWTRCSFQSKELNLVFMSPFSFLIAAGMFASVGCEPAVSLVLKLEVQANSAWLLASSSSSPSFTFSLGGWFWVRRLSFSDASSRAAHSWILKEQVWIISMIFRESEAELLRKASTPCGAHSVGVLLLLSRHSICCSWARLGTVVVLL